MTSSSVSDGDGDREDASGSKFLIVKLCGGVIVVRHGAPLALDWRAVRVCSSAYSHLPCLGTTYLGTWGARVHTTFNFEPYC